MSLGKRIEKRVRRHTPCRLREKLRPFFAWLKAGRRPACPTPILYAPQPETRGGHDHAVVRIVLMVADPAERLQLAATCRAAWCHLVDPAEYIALAGDYVVFPSARPDGILERELRAAYLALTAQDLDIVVISRGLEAAPTVRFAAQSEPLIVKSALLPCLERRRPFPPGLKGRIVRSVGAFSMDEHAVVSTLDAVLGIPVTNYGQAFVTGTGATPSHARRPAAAVRQPLDPVAGGDTRPVILVLPGVFAVGGVERNTVEVIRALASRYRFVVATTEPHEPVRGSLHHQLDGLCEDVYDLGEIAPTSAHLDLLTRLDERHGFSCIWIVNGSTWLSDNLDSLRNAFRHVPIVDQQVYDTEHGWISNYDSPAIKHFDHHVAINCKIADAFKQRHGIAAERVHLVYHAIDAGKWEVVARDRSGADAVRKAWGVPAGAPVFGCIGRLTDQKRPLAFLDLARRAQAAGQPGIFALVGDGEMAEQCRAFVRQHDLKNVRMPGFIGDPADVHAALTGLVITSAYEGLPIVSLEAMAIGTPILATDVGDLRLVGENRGSVTIFASADEAGRFADFRRWSDDLARHACCAQDAAASVRAAFGVDVIAGQYADLFARAMAERRPRRAVPARQGCASVSIVMPTFNRCDLLAQALPRYAASMVGLDCELIVIDDGSTDETRQVLERFAREDDRVRFTTQPNCGPARARNTGASLATKDVVLFVGDDILPCDERFVRTHALLHARQPDDGFAVLGKVVWPTEWQSHVTAVMRHVQGASGEQFGYAHFRPYSILDWRFFYTCNVSVKRRIVADWKRDGFSNDFPSAAFEDIEFAYRMYQRRQGLRIYFDPASRGDHHHLHTVRTFIDRQFAAGLMAAVFVKKHPAVARDLALDKLIALMKRRRDLARGLCVADLLSVIEGAKSFALLLEARGGLGDAHWHTGFLQALFEMVTLQGFVAGWAPHALDADAGYEAVLSGFLRRIDPLAAIESPGLHEEIRRLNAALKAA